MSAEEPRHVSGRASAEQDALAEFGFAGLVVEPIKQVAWPVSRVMRGASPNPEQWASEKAVYLPIGIDPATIGGLISRYEKDPGIVKFEARRGVHLERARVPARVASRVLVVHGDHAFVNLRDAGTAVLELSGRAPVMLRDLGRDLDVSIIVEPIEVTPFVMVPPPPSDTVAACEDAWLRERMRDHLQIHDSWHNAVTAGLYLRLHRSDGSSRGVVPTLAGSWPHVWVRQLSTSEVETLVSRTIARVHGLWTDLERLDRDLDLDDDDWRGDFGRWCGDRDDLEGVRVLLNWARHGRPVEQVLKPFDLAAERFVRSIPVVLRIRDKQLERAASASPTGWWTRPVHPDDPRS